MQMERAKIKNLSLKSCVINFLFGFLELANSNKYKNENKV